MEEPQEEYGAGIGSRSAHSANHQGSGEKDCSRAEKSQDQSKKAENLDGAATGVLELRIVETEAIDERNTEQYSPHETRAEKDGKILHEPRSAAAAHLKGDFESRHARLDPYGPDEFPKTYLSLRHPRFSASPTCHWAYPSQKRTV